MYILGKAIVEAAIDVTHDFCKRSSETFADECNKMTYGSMDNAGTATAACIRVPREIAQWTWEDIKKMTGEATAPVFDSMNSAYNSVTGGASWMFNKAVKGARKATSSLVDTISTGGSEVFTGVRDSADKIFGMAARGARDAVNGVTRGAKHLVGDASRSAKAATTPPPRDRTDYGSYGGKAEKQNTGQPRGWHESERRRR
mmetsp:Transcript_11625/g.15756  ORF Transcript_11625/g.15756 Transcript_11625/m.15756 type:complete len:201 (+) Transcript_11625:195-797(+)|eukprot:CAMPEP_0170453946 /NCGR_PEP_ID=MMETSP0123-20130129/2367_1 /TAXON_ID=182087 /ORGANISM="Favella ehrenbergii, Strain Fehren 1" /LENGTH=200 /DNA_ID=CAMNT_0010716505 /DNA_START=118 /DNA_END=720 /DNA_ORIENTATION=+